MDIDKVSKVIFRFHRILGIIFTLIGVLFVYATLKLLLDLDATIRINGVETNEFDKKLFAVIFSSLFLLIGLFFTLVPKSTCDKYFVQKNYLLNSLFKKKEE